MAHSWGQKVVRFYDPDGHLIEVGTPMRGVRMARAQWKAAGQDLPARGHNAQWNRTEGILLARLPRL